MLLDLPFAFCEQGFSTSPASFPECNIKTMLLKSNQKINWKADPCANWDGSFDDSRADDADVISACDNIEDVSNNIYNISAAQLDNHLKVIESMFHKPVKLSGTPSFANKKILWNTLTDFFYAKDHYNSAVAGDTEYAKVRKYPFRGNTLSYISGNLKTAIYNNWEKLYRNPGILIDSNHYASLDSLPHLLVAGTTGSGKSVFLESLILTLAVTHPTDLKMVLFDPKQVELSRFSGAEFLHPMINEIFGTDVITEVFQMPEVLSEIENIMDNRLKNFRAKGARNIEEYNRVSAYPEQRIVCVIDEFADVSLQCGKKFSDILGRIAAKSRAAGIHLVLATQKPTRDVMGPLVKANAPARVAFKVTCATDSRVILDQNGAETLQNPGDGIFKSPNLGCFKFKGLLPGRSDSRNVADAFKVEFRKEYADERIIRKYSYRMLVDIVWARKLLYGV